MRLVMMGTGAFAAPTFESLYATHHEIVALITSPLRTRKSRTTVTTPMRDVASAHSTPIHDPNGINTPETLGFLRSLKPDLYVVCDFGYILSAEALATARLGGVNLHCSLLPKYRGAAPVNWALYNGDETSGVSVIHMTPKVDAGPVIAQSPPTPIEDHETAVELKARLSDIGAWFVRRAIDSLEAGILRAIPQDPQLASRAPKLSKEDGVLQWDRSAEQVRNQYRAMQPWPKTYTFWRRGDGQTMRIIIGDMRVVDSNATAPPGTIVSADGDGLVVATGEGAVELLDLQPSGKREMTAEEFLRGYSVRIGDRFGAEDDSPSAVKRTAAG